MPINCVRQFGCFKSENTCTISISSLAKMCTKAATAAVDSAAIVTNKVEWRKRMGISFNPMSWPTGYELRWSQHFYSLSLSLFIFSFSRLAFIGARMFSTQLNCYYHALQAMICLLFCSTHFEHLELLLLCLSVCFGSRVLY